MNDKLNSLNIALCKLGNQSAANEINILIGELGSISSGIISKADWRTSLLGEAPVGSAAPQDAEAWQRLIDDYDKPPYRVEYFHTLAEGLAASVISPIMSKIRAVRADEGVEPTQADRDEVISKLRTTAGTNLSSANKFKKIAADVNYLERLDKNTDNSIRKMLVKLPRKYASQRDMLYIESELLRIKEGAGSSVAKAPVGFFGRAMPVVGLALSVPLALKNIVEAWHNGVAVFTELPLSKYGISKASIAAGPAGALFLVRQLKSEIEKNKEDPNALYDLLVICKTISALWLDLIFAVTNSFMAIIDALTILAGIASVAAVLDGPILEVVTGFASVIASFVVIGIELGSEWLTNRFWENIKVRIKEIAEEKLQGEASRATVSRTSEPTSVTGGGSSGSEAPAEQQGWRNNLFGEAPVPA